MNEYDNQGNCLKTISLPNRFIKSFHIWIKTSVSLYIPYPGES